MTGNAMDRSDASATGPATTPETPPSVNLASLEAILMDLDGVVTETAEVHAKSWKAMFDEYLRARASRLSGTFAPFDIDRDYRRYVDGKPRFDGVASFLQSRGISLPLGNDRDPPDKETIHGLGNRKNQLFLKAIRRSGVTTYPSSVDFIRRVRAEGLRVAVVTSSRNGREVLAAAGIEDLFDARVDGLVARDCWLDGKPAPDTYLEAARRLGAKPQASAVVEDAVSGVQAGRAGRFGLVIGVSRGGEPQLLRRSGADIVVSDLGDLTLDKAMEKNEEAIPPLAFDRMEDVHTRIGQRQIAVFLDYDGTLTPIVERPDLAVLSERMRDTLAKLARQTTVVVVSGRERGNVEALVGLQEIVYAGCHGFDIAGPEGTAIQHEEGKDYLPLIREVAAELHRQLDSIEGVIIENKTYAIAVHFRLVSPEAVAEVEQTVDRTIAEHPRLRKTGGKKVFELRPKIPWDKGKAVLWLLDALALNRDEVLPIYLGDDVTDFDAFRALRGRGLSLLVAEEAEPSSADYRLRDPEEAGRFLNELAKLLEERPGAERLGAERLDDE